MELEQRYRKELKRQRHEKFEQEHPKRDVIGRNSFEFKERLRKRKERRQHEKQEFWEEHREYMESIEEEQKMIKVFRDAGWKIGYLGGRDRGLMK